MNFRWRVNGEEVPAPRVAYGGLAIWESHELRSHLRPIEPRQKRRVYNDALSPPAGHRAVPLEQELGLATWNLLSGHAVALGAADVAA